MADSLLRHAMEFNNAWKEGTGQVVERKKVSVIIPAYKPGYIAEVIFHLSQVNDFYEIIIVNDLGQEDLSLNEVAKKYSNVKLINHKKNYGRPCARNTGASYATGEILLFLDQDIFLSPDYIENMYRLMLANDYAAIVLGMRETTQKENIPSLEKWHKYPPRKDWRMDVLPEDSYMDLTVLEVGHLTNRCERGKRISIYQETDGLRKFGIKAENTIGFWDLPSMVVSHTMAMSKEHFFRIGGFPEWISGWGGEDIVIGFLAIANGVNIILSESVSYQVEHELYSGSEENKCIELQNNLVYYRKWASQITENPRVDVDKCRERGIFFNNDK